MNDFEARVELDALMSSDAWWRPGPKDPQLVARVEQLAERVGEAKERDRRLAESELERRAKDAR